MNRRTRVAALAAVVALISAGCSTTPPEASMVDPLQPSMPGWATDAPSSAGVELVGAEVAGLISMPWRLAAIDEDRRTITVAFVAGDGDCIVHAGYSLSLEGSTMTLGEFSRSSGQAVCADKGELGVEILTLPIRLDDGVTLVHQIADEKWSALLE